MTTTPRILLLLALLLALTLSGCATNATHPALQNAELAKLIPLRDFVANIKSNYHYQISPDGKTVAWIAVKGIRATIFFRAVDSETEQSIDTHSNRSIKRFHWGQNSKTLFFHRDTDGDENYHVFAANIDTPNAIPIDMTPVAGARATIVSIPRNRPQHILIQHNQRDKSVFDLFRLDLKDRSLTRLADNPGGVVRWLIDDDGTLRGRYRKLDDHSRVLEVPSDDDQAWRKVVGWAFDDIFHVLGFTADNASVWAISNRQRNLTILVRLNLASGKSNLIYGEQDVDLERVFISSITHQPVFAASMPAYPRLHFFNPKAEIELQAMQKNLGGYAKIISVDNLERSVIVAISSDQNVMHYLYNRDTGQRQLLGQHHLKEYVAELATTKPIEFSSRDGLTLHGYLTLPRGVSEHPLPMIVKVHGGPWARDGWGLNTNNQFLANRGYAVLQINYRGSAGYGKQFQQAAIGEFAAKMHTDLLDGVDWAINQGIADKDKICISGRSYGGYATLVAMTFTPEVFACGIDVVGPSNLVSLLENGPKYWRHSMPFWHKYVGNPEDPAQRKQMEEKSPLFKIEDVSAPLLIVQGANDPRVTQLESDQMVEALRASGKEVEYLLFENEGHRISRWTNNLIYYRKMEDFLAKHLGGRSAGFDYYEIGTLLFQ